MGEAIFLCYLLKIFMKRSFMKNTIDEKQKAYYDGLKIRNKIS